MGTVFLVLIVLLVIVVLSGNFWPEANRPHATSVSLLLVTACLVILGLMAFNGGKL